MSLAVVYEVDFGPAKLAELREELIVASVRYVRYSRIGSRADRIREASDAAGIPRCILESRLELRSTR